MNKPVVFPVAPVNVLRGRAASCSEILAKATGSLLLLALMLLLATPAMLAGAALPAGFSEDTVDGPPGGWDNPVGIAFDSAARMFVWERTGRVWFRDDGDTSWSMLLDISDEVGAWGDYGLVGFALDPNFRVNGHIYLMYVVDRHHLLFHGTPTYNPASNNYFNATIGRITRYTARPTDGFRSVDPNSRFILLGETKETGIPILHDSHGVGTLLFGTDGTLLVSTGDGASYTSVDVGSASETFYSQALADGIITQKENIGAYRSLLLDSHDGKVLRLDPETGNGLPGNPFYDSANPRSAISRVWALGLRNPYRMSLRPNTGSHIPADANPGVLYIGDVGWTVWEELNVCTAPAQNFGWPHFEGIEEHSGYVNSSPFNRDAPNPLYPASGCSQFFRFRDLISQHASNPADFPPFANPCSPGQNIPGTIPQFLHTPPAIDWRHGTTQARTWIFDATGEASAINISSTASPVSGSMFRGNCSIGGLWYTGTDFPAQYQNKYFAADYGDGWIKYFTFTDQNVLVSVSNFASGVQGIVGLYSHPTQGGLYYITQSGIISRISYTAAQNLPPRAIASSDVQFGPSPLVVQFSGQDSSDPEGSPLAFLWDFGDGTPISTLANPSHTFNAPIGIPASYQVTLTVTDSLGQSSTATLLVSANNTPPEVTILNPVDHSLFSITASTPINLSALVNDAESPNEQLSYAWKKFLHHNDHEHQDPALETPEASTVISPIGCDGINIYYYRIELTVTDPAGLSTTRSVSLFPDCGTPNTPPIISEIPDQTTLAGTSTGPISFTINDAEVAPANLQLSATSSNPALVPVNNINFGGEGDSRTVTIQPRSGVSGVVTIGIVVNDGPNEVVESLSLEILAGDTTPPSVAITAPLPNSSLAGTVSIQASALDNIGVLGVQFQLNGLNLGLEDLAPPYSLSLNTWTIPNGDHTLTAIARDAAGNQASSIAIPVTVANSGPPPAVGLVAAYAFDEGSGTLAGDSSGLGNHGTLAGATWTSEGQSGGALSFNGSQSVNIPDAPSLDLSTGMTLEAWVYPTTLSDWRTVILKETASGLAYALYANENVTLPSAYVRVGGDARVGGNAGLPLNTWTHLAATYDGANFRLFVNGTQVGSRALTGNIPASGNPLRIGGNQVWGEYFIGQIDEVRLYNRALTPEEIQTDMSIPIGTPLPPDVTPPTSPANVLASGSFQQVNLSWDPSSDDIGVTHYNVHRSVSPGFLPSVGNRIAQAVAPSFSDSPLAPGVYYYLVTAEDAAGNLSLPSNEASATALSDTTPPSVSITAPSQDAIVSGTISITATASDNAEVVGVQFLLDGAPLGSEDTTVPFSFSWNTISEPNSLHELSAIARDAAGNSASSAPIAIQVLNTAPPPITGLVAAYSFDEGTGSIVNDSSGLDNHGTLAGATWTSEGQSGGALSFNGSQSVNIPDASSLDLSTGMTLEAWVYPTTLSDWRTVILKETASGLAYALYANENVTLPSAYVRVGGDARVGGNAGLPLNTWTHLAATYDGTNFRLFVNGTQVGSRALTGNIPASSNPLRIGGNQVWGEYFIGQIDEVRLYNRALTVAEIQQDMATPVGEPPPADTTAPTAPGSLAATGAFQQVALNWDPATDDFGVLRYNVHRAATSGFIPSIANRIAQPVGTSFLDSGLTPGPYYYVVTAEDVAGNISLPSDEVLGIALADTTPPSAPANLVASGAVQQVALSWNPSSDNAAISNYNVHRSTSSGFIPSPANRVAQPVGTTFLDSGLAPGAYYYLVTAVDTAGNISAPSIEVTGTALADTTPPAVALTAPAHEAILTGTVSITASASDDIAVAGVQFRLGGVNLGLEDTAPPYSVNWDTTPLPDGSYVLDAVARDAAGNHTTSSPITVQVSNTAPPPPLGLMAAYGFNEGVGSTTADASGNGHTGAISGATWDPAGHSGAALVFSGSNQRVNINDSDALDLTRLTMEGWVNPTALSGWRTVVLKESSSGLAYALYAHDNVPTPAAYLRIGGSDVRLAGNSPLPLNTWTHLAATYDGTTFRLFVNGVQVNSRSTTGNVQVSTLPLRIGGNSVWGEYFSGRIDDVRIYNRALTPDEILTDMNTSSP